MPSRPSRVSRMKIVRWLWKPAVATAAGSTAVAVWLDEIVLYAEEILGLILLPIMGGLIYLFDNYLFGCTRPRPADLKPRPERREHGDQ